MADTESEGYSDDDFEVDGGDGAPADTPPESAADGDDDGASMRSASPGSKAEAGSDGPKAEDSKKGAADTGEGDAEPAKGDGTAPGGASSTGRGAVSPPQDGTEAAGSPEADDAPALSPNPDATAPEPTEDKGTAGGEMPASADAEAGGAKPGPAPGPEGEAVESAGPDAPAPAVDDTRGGGGDEPAAPGADDAHEPEPAADGGDAKAGAGADAEDSAPGTDVSARSSRRGEADGGAPPVLLDFPEVRAGAEPKPLSVSAGAASHLAVAAVLRSDDVSLEAWVRRASLDEHAAAVDGGGLTLLHVLALKSKTEAMVAVLGAAAERLRARRDASRDEARRAALHGGADDEGGRRRELLTALDAAERLYHCRREEHARRLLGARDENGRTALHHAAAAHGAAARCLLEALPVAGADLGAVGPSGLPLFPRGAFVDSRTGRLFGAPSEYDDPATLQRAAETGGDASPARPAAVTSPFRPRREAAAVGATKPRGQPLPLPLSPGPGSPGLRSRRRRATDDAGFAPPAWAGVGGAAEPDGDGAAWAGGRAASEATAPDGSARLAVDDIPVARAEWVDCVDDDGYSALHVASALSDAPATRLLVAAGADRYLRSADGETPMSLATSDEVRRVLLPIGDAVRDACDAEATAKRSRGGRGPRGGEDGADAEAKASTAHPGPAATESQQAAMLEGPVQALRILLSTGINPNARSGTLLRAPLHAASEAGQPDVVAVLLQSGAVVDVVDANGWTPLALAAHEGTSPSSASPGHMEVVRRLLDAGARINATTSMRRTALHLAAMMRGASVGGSGGARSSRRPSVSASVSAADDPGEEPSSHRGAQEPGAAMLWLLLERQADAEAKDDDGLTPLLHAARHGRTSAAATLLACGAFSDATTSRGATALHLAAKHGHAATCRLLARHDAERGALKRALDTAGRSPTDLAKDARTREALDTLWEAAAAGRLDMTQRLLRAASRVPAGASAPWLPVRVADATPRVGRTALHAVVTGAAARLAPLRGSSVKGAAGAPRGRGGRRAAGASAAERRMGRIVAGVGMRAGPGGGTRHPAVTAPLPPRHPGYKAAVEAEESFSRVAALLLSNGADPDAPDADGVTATMLAARFGLLGLLRVLLPRCVVTAADAAGNTALHWARAYGQELAAETLEDEGAPADAVNAEGKTAEEVAGTGSAIVPPDSAERDAAAARPAPKRSRTLQTTTLRDELSRSGAAV